MQRPDNLDVGLVVGLGIELDRLGGDRRRGKRLGVALHLQIHPDLEQLERGQLAHRLGAGLGRERLQRALQPQRRVGLGGDREPQVELVVAQVVVGYAGVGVDDLCGAVGILRIDLGRDQHRGVAERARVEDRRDLADDALVKQVLHARHHLALLHPGELGHTQVGARLDREAALHQVEQALVELVERDRRAVLAAAALSRPPVAVSVVMPSVARIDTVS